jgi:hypothetical protein
MNIIVSKYKHCKKGKNVQYFHFQIILPKQKIEFQLFNTFNTKTKQKEHTINIKKKIKLT